VKCFQPTRLFQLRSDDTERYITNAEQRCTVAVAGREVYKMTATWCNAGSKRRSSLPHSSDQLCVRTSLTRTSPGLANRRTALSPRDVSVDRSFTATVDHRHPARTAPCVYVTDRQTDRHSQTDRRNTSHQCRRHITNRHIKTAQQRTII